MANSQTPTNKPVCCHIWFVKLAPDIVSVQQVIGGSSTRRQENKSLKKQRTNRPRRTRFVHTTTLECSKPSCIGFDRLDLTVGPSLITFGWAVLEVAQHAKKMSLEHLCLGNASLRCLLMWNRSNTIEADGAFFPVLATHKTPRSKNLLETRMSK